MPDKPMLEECLGALSMLWAHVAVPTEAAKFVDELNKRVPSWKTDPVPRVHQDIEGQKTLQRLKAWDNARKLLERAGRI